MSELRQEFCAPWGRLLMGMSGGVVLLFLGIAIAGRADVPFLILFPLLLLCSLPFMVQGYVVSEKELVVKRLGWATRFPLDGLESVEVDPKAMKGSFRVFGNGGLFSFTGLYRNKKLGTYRVFVNDPEHAVVMCLPKRTIVVSPDDPAGFVDTVRSSAFRRPVQSARPPEGGTTSIHKGTNRQQDVTQQ